MLARLLEPLPIPVRTLDAFHLASAEFLRGSAIELELATFDERLARAAARLRIPTYRLE